MDTPDSIDEPNSVVIPVGIITWQIQTAPAPPADAAVNAPEPGAVWGPYLCLPVEGGVYSRQGLAARIQALLQSTIREEERLEWSVWLVAGTARMGFALARAAAGASPPPPPAVTAFRIAPAAPLADAIGCRLDADGWIVSAGAWPSVPTAAVSEP